MSATSDGKEYTYDAVGNMLSDGARRMTYDAESRLTRVVMNSGITEFVYDGSGARTKKIENLGDTTLYMGGLFEKSRFEMTKHIYAGGLMVASATSARGSDARTVYYYHGDHLGSTSVVSDGNGARPVAPSTIRTARPSASQACPAGSITATPARCSTRKPGSTSTTRRYYSPALGRFISADTIVPLPTNPQSLNRYSYVLNNPVRYIDPSGHGGWEDFWNGVGKALSDVGQWISHNWETIVYAIGTVVVIVVAVISRARCRNRSHRRHGAWGCGGRDARWEHRGAHSSGRLPGRCSAGSRPRPGYQSSWASSWRA